MKAPIALQTTQQPLTFSDSFAEKIAANYKMMASRFTPKDLLFLLVAPPEYPELAGGGTSIAMQTDIRQTRNMLVEVVNNVVNRILLMQDQSFTYQDQVYISNFLEKIGITDASQFVREVRSLTEESMNIHKLLALYQENSSLLTLALEARKPPKTHRKRKKETKKPKSEEGQQLTLHTQIYQRLGTEEIYRIFQRFQQNAILRQNALHHTELRVSNQRRSGDMIALTQIKRSLFPYMGTPNQQHINRFETGELLPFPTAEGQALSQGAAAAVADLVSNVLISRISQYAARQGMWMNIRNAVSQSAQYSLARFESYHTGNATLPAERQITYHMNTLQREETQLLERFIRTEAQANPTLPPRLQAADDTPGITMVHSSHSLSLTAEGEQNLEAIVQLQMAEIRLYSTLLSSRQEENFSLQTLLESGAFSAESRTILNQLFAATSTVLQVQPPPDGEEVPLVDRREPDPYSPLLEALERADTAVSQEDRAELQRRLEEINRQNLIRQQQALERQAERPRYEVPTSPDKKRTFQDALRAIDNPDQLLQELRDSPPPPPRRTPQQASIEILLAQADPETRQIYEAVFRYQNNPQESIQAGLVRPENLTAFNQQVMASQEVISKTVEEITQLEEETRQLKARIGRGAFAPGLEHPGEGGVSGPEQISPRPRVPTIHKSAGDTGFPEELLERLEEQQRRQETHSLSTRQTETTQETVQQTHITRQNAELVQKTTDDIAEIVNRTLARQMGAISDQVLSRMERRLELDRARRGRF